MDLGVLSPQTMTSREAVLPHEPCCNCNEGNPQYSSHGNTCFYLRPIYWVLVADQTSRGWRLVSSTRRRSQCRSQC